MRRKIRLKAMWFITIFFAGAWTLLVLNEADAFELQIHGYGDQGYLVTDTNKNKYLTADHDGTFDFTHLSLVFSAAVDDKTTIWSQLANIEEEGISIHWVFVDYKVNNDLMWRAGQIKFPMGFYNENKRAKILHLSTLEPQMYQDLMGEEVIPEMFRGGSVVYNHDISDGNIGIELFGGQRFSHDPDRRYHNTYGGTVNYRAPIDGLRFEGSAFTSKKEDLADVPPIEGTQFGWLVGADYVNHGFDLKVEYADSKDPDLNIVTYYGQAGYTFFDKLTPFVRYDYITTNQDFDDDPSYYQKDTVVGVGYKISSNLALKAEEHFLHGYAMPVKRGDMEAGTGKTDWNLFAASVNFIF